MASLHVVQLLPELNEGGVERTVVELNRELVRRGVTSTVISRGGRLVAEIEKDGGRHIALDVCSKNPLTFPWRAEFLRWTLRKLQPDVIHVHSRMPGWLLHAANRWAQRPVVTTVHGFNSVSGYSRVMTEGVRVICVSHAIRAYIRENYRTPEERIRVIHPAVNATIFDPARVDAAFVAQFRQEHKLDRRMVATSVGRITQLKGFETFIRAVALARRTRPELVGVIVGGTRPDKRDYEARLQALVRELDVGDAIRFVGNQSKMPEIYALSDVVVSCSVKPESFGLSLVEALAMNTPVIATRHGGALEIVREGVDGALFIPDDDDALAQLLAAFHRTPNTDLRTETLRRFSAENTIEQTVAVYRDAQQAARC